MDPDVGASSLSAAGSKPSVAPVPVAFEHVRNAAAPAPRTEYKARQVACSRCSANSVSVGMYMYISFHFIYFG